MSVRFAVEQVEICRVIIESFSPMSFALAAIIFSYLLSEGNTYLDLQNHGFPQTHPCFSNKMLDLYRHGCRAGLRSSGARSFL
jgi:hypothetical protein